MANLGGEESNNEEQQAKAAQHSERLEILGYRVAATLATPTADVRRLLRLRGGKNWGQKAGRF